MFCLFMQPDQRSPLPSADRLSVTFNMADESSAGTSRMGSPVADGRHFHQATNAHYLDLGIATLFHCALVSEGNRNVVINLTLVSAEAKVKIKLFICSARIHTTIKGTFSCIMH